MKKYKLLKDLPTNKAGTIFTTTDNHEYTPVGDAYPKISLLSMGNLEWFEEVFEWPKSWEDVQDCNSLWSWAKNQLLFINPHRLSYNSIVARLKLEEIAKEMNGDWEPDWSDSDMFKYTIVSNSKRLKITYNWRDPKLLVFKTKEMAEFSLNHHRELWEDYWMINK
jgi:hypothetical protein